MDNETYQNAVLDLLADLVKEQQTTRDAVITLAEAIAGKRRAVETAVAEKPAEPQPEAPTPAPEHQPDAESAPSVTINDLRDLFATKSREGKKDELKAVLDKFGVAKLPQLDPALYADVKAAVVVL